MKKIIKIICIIVSLLLVAILTLYTGINVWAKFYLPLPDPNKLYEREVGFYNENKNEI